MTATNDFQQFANAGGANVLTQAEYLALAGTILADGYPSGILASQYLNKTLRQSATMAALIGDFIVAQTGQNAVDDGTTATLLTNLTAAINSSINGYNPGDLKIYSGTLNSLAGFLRCPTSQTFVNATTYKNLAFAVQSAWGAGGSIINSGSFVVGNTYSIRLIGTTDFTLIGATANTVGLTFTATGIGDGTGTAYDSIGIPYFAAGYVPLQGTPGAITHGQVLDHIHNTSYAVYNNSANSSLGAGASNSTQSVISTTNPLANHGPDNLAAGMGIQIFVKY